MTYLYRLLLRLLAPHVAERHGDDAVAATARLADDARHAGRAIWLRYWLTEFRSLGRIAWAERLARVVAMARDKRLLPRKA